MTEFVHDLAALEIHHRSIRPYGGAKRESIKASTSGCRVAYNLYIGSIMNREACFSMSIHDDEHNLGTHSIREDVDYGPENELCSLPKDEWR